MHTKHPIPKSGRISLKWRLILAFLGVSVMPVLVASYLAATAIQNVFDRNLEHWISEAAWFLLSEITETEEEAGKGRPERGRHIAPAVTR